MDSSGEPAPYGSARLYFFNDGVQRLCIVQLAFQLKNMWDSVVHSDGIIFLLHHAATASLAYFALHPFAHLYGPFFFGISELSTAVLCCLAAFGDEVLMRSIRIDLIKCLETNLMCLNLAGKSRCGNQGSWPPLPQC